MRTVVIDWNIPKYSTTNQPKDVNLDELDHELALKVIERVRQNDRNGETYYRVGFISAYTGMRLKDVFELTERK